MSAMAPTEALLRVWYGGRRPSLWLRALAALYGSVAGMRAWLYRRGVLRRVALPVPVLVVGNITVGGSGKTPLVIALVEHLRAQGRRPGVVSRGYGGRQVAPRLLDAAATPAEVGDEPCLIRQRTAVPVAVGHDRPAAARLLLGAGVDVIVADDGLQHHRLARDIEICVIDGVRRLGNGRLLPAGPLREPAARLSRVDFRICNGGQPQTGEVPMQLLADTARALDDPQRTLPLSTWSGQRVHAVAGIGHPPRFFQTLRGQGIAVVEHGFPDHHAYRVADLAFRESLPVLMTEKDAVKCEGIAGADTWSVPVRAALPARFLAALDARLREIAGGQQAG